MIKKFALGFLVVSLIFPSLALAAWGRHIHPEKYYQQAWCQEHQGVMEFVLPDRARVDCVTDGLAVEFDFGPKWAESIGQALYYATQTNRKAAIVLILEYPKWDIYYQRLVKTIEGHKLDVEVYKVTPFDYPPVQKDPKPVE